MKHSLIINDENAWISTFLNIVLILLIGGIIYFVVDLVASGDLEELAEDAGGGLWGGIVGITAGFFGGAWRTGKEIGERTSFVPEFIKSLKFW
jgi:hypothetical protein